METQKGQPPWFAYSELCYLLKHLIRKTLLSRFQISNPCSQSFNQIAWTQFGLYHLANGNIRRTTAVVSLSSNNHVVERPQVHTQVLPSSEVVSSSDGSLGALALANRPVLGERSSTFNGRLVDSLAGVDIVSAAVASNRALLCCARRWIVGSKVFDNVEFDQGVCGPAVDRKVAVSCWNC